LFFVIYLEKHQLCLCHPIHRVTMALTWPYWSTGLYNLCKFQH